MSNNIQEQKWQKLLKRAWLFRFIPFVDFVLVAGSMAMGSEEENSDFDVIVGCRQGRIFTARFCCWFVFGLFGWRRVNLGRSDLQNIEISNSGRSDLRRLNSDKFCFSHFVTPAAYRLSPPHNTYWQKLYQSIVPVFGEPQIIQKFYDANADWAGPVRNSPPDGSFGPRLRAGAVSNGMGWLLSGKLGNLMEKTFRKIQVKKIEKGLADVPKYNPRIIYSDNELEFHPHTKRIEDFLKNS